MNEVSKPPGGDPLLTFAGSLRLGAEMIRNREGLSRLRFSDKEFRAETAKEITQEAFNMVTETYGRALTCRFLIGDDTLLAVREGISDHDLARFHRDIGSSPYVELELEIDKDELIRQWLGEPGNVHIRLFLFKDSLSKALDQSPLTIEEQLLGKDGEKTILVVPDVDIFLDGQYFAVAGGARLKDIGHMLPDAPLPLGPVLRMREGRRENNVSWVGFELKKLTPAHLQLGTNDHAGGNISVQLALHLIRLVVLYTADRAVMSQGDRILASYSASGYSSEVEFSWEKVDGKSLTEASLIMRSAAQLGRICSWIYETDQTISSRLPVVQLVMARELSEDDPTLNFELLFRAGRRIAEDSKHSWKAFLEGRLETYFNKIKALEDAVATKTAEYAALVDTMTSKLVENMLAAVAVVIGSFIGSLLGDNFNPTVFKTGLWIYAIYLLLFPLGFAMLQAYRRFQGSTKEFAQRRRLFEERLFRNQVDEIIGGTVVEGERRFKTWFAVIAFTYLLVAILAILASIIVPAAFFGPTAG